MQLPKFFLDSLQTANGFSYDAFVQAHEHPAVITSVRVHPTKKNNEGLHFHPANQTAIQTPLFAGASTVSWCNSGYYLATRPSFTLDPLFHAGCYYVQEASSMFIEQAVKKALPRHNSTAYRVLDLCAAPGGKSTHLASLFSEGLVVANEVIKTRAGTLAENALKWGTGNIVVTSNDSTDFKSLEGYFDVILVDAPCSGSGMFRKDPDAITEWSPENVLHCSKRQQRILEDIWPCLKENGLLIYSTCSYSVEENELIADWLGQQFAVTSLQLDVPPEWNIVQSQSPLLGFEGYRFYPDKTKGEGFFMTCFIKKNTTASPSFTNRKKLQNASKTEEAVLGKTLLAAQTQYFFRLEEDFVAFPQQWTEDLHHLAAVLYVKKAGIRVGKIIKSELIPDHELALSTLIINGFSTAELDTEQALAYLRKQDINIQSSFKGWCLVTYNGFNLGWVKILPNRVNNYYPQRFRILKH